MPRGPIQNVEGLNPTPAVRKPSTAFDDEEIGNDLVPDRRSKLLIPTVAENDQVIEED